ncbi:MAG: sigma 54-interacting transcriptional regulator, partial [Planctomycetota bacterium]
MTADDSDSSAPESSSPPPTPPVLASALASWRRTGRVTEALPQLVAAAIAASQAERGFLFTYSDEGNYRVRLARNADGEPLVDAVRWISHFVVQRALLSDGPIFFEDTRSDRRFRTEGEREAGAKTRAIAVVPIRVADEDVFLYLDARFREIVWNETTLPALEPIFDLLTVLLEVESAEQAVRATERKYERKIERLERDAQPAEPAVRRPTVRTSANVEREVDFHGFRTRNPALIESVAELEKLAPSMLSILVEGESGTGKEVMARAIHAASGRSGRFVSLHCGALPETLVEIELYGHDRGAFTGADRARTGLLELARGGTLFLDDIGEMTDELQNGLLRVLESSTYRPVSGSEERTVDVRVLSSSLIGNEGEHTTTSIRHDL